jgi:hypothetical protein
LWFSEFHPWLNANVLFFEVFKKSHPVLDQTQTKLRVLVLCLPDFTENSIPKWVLAARAVTVHGRGTCLLWVVKSGISAWLHSNPQPVATEDGDAYPQDCITQKASLLENRNAGLIVGLGVRV